MAHIEIPFAIGEKLWAVSPSRTPERMTCPDCLGTLSWILQLPNGSTLSVPCGTCSRGYDGPCGHVEIERYDFMPRLFVPGRVDIRGGEFDYSESGPDETCYNYSKSTDLYRNREECEAECLRRTEEQRKRIDEHNASVRQSKRREAIDMAGYRRKEIRRLTEELERHKALLSVTPTEQPK